MGTKTATKAAAKSGRQGIKQGAQASEATGFVFPLGPGLQVGLWRGISTKIWVTGHNTCGECTPVGFSRG